MSEEILKGCVSCISCGSQIYQGMVYEMAENDGRQFICESCLADSKRISVCATADFIPED